MHSLVGLRHTWESLRLFVQGDLTTRWVATPAAQDLVINLDSASLNDVRLFDPIDRLSWLGPCDKCDRTVYHLPGSWKYLVFFQARRELQYFARGISIGVRARNLVERLWLHIAEGDGFSPFRGKIVRDGKEISIAPSMRNADIRAILGTPDRIDDQGDPCPVWPGYEYYFDDATVSIHFSDEGTVSQIGISEDCRYNPTQGWIRDESIELVADLDKGSLCGVGIGDAFNDFQFLGRASEYMKMSVSSCDRFGESCDDESEVDTYKYASLGVQIDAEKGRVSSIQIQLRESSRRTGRAFPGTVVLDGQRHKVDAFLTSDQISQIFGPPEATNAGEPGARHSVFQHHVYKGRMFSVWLDSKGNAETLNWCEAGPTPENPTKLWENADKPPLTANWDDMTLCGVRLGEPLERIRFLGPANHAMPPAEKAGDGDPRYVENRRGARVLYFGSHSIHCTIDSDERLVLFGFQVTAGDDDWTKPWEGVMYRGNGASLSLEGHTEEQIVNILGNPDRVVLHHSKNGKVNAKWLIYEGEAADRSVLLLSPGIAHRVEFRAKTKGE